MADPGPIARLEQRDIEHHSHLRRYATVWIALLVLTFVTWAVAKVHLPGGWAVTVALGVACVKGALVALFFMHLYDQQGANRLVFITSLVFVALLIGLTISDNATRFPLANPPGAAGALPPGGAGRDPPPAR
jgi:cytochrome c oxidase subunit 4